MRNGTMSKDKKNLLIGFAIIVATVVGVSVTAISRNHDMSPTETTKSETKTSKIEKLADQLDKHANEMTVQEIIDKIKAAGFDYSVNEVEINIDGDSWIDASKPLPVDMYSTVHAQSVSFYDWSPEDKNTIYINPADEVESLREGVTRNSDNDKSSSSRKNKSASSKSQSTSKSSVDDGDFYVTGKKTISANEAGTYNVTAVAGDNILLYVMNDKSSDTMGNLKFSENMAVNPDQDEQDMGFVTTTVVDVSEGNVVEPNGGTVKFEKIQ